MAMYRFELHPEHKVTRAIARQMSRRQLISWLTWNDPNGVYSDEQALKEFGSIMSYKSALEHALRQLEN
jgi:hypothetical protein